MDKVDEGKQIYHYGTSLYHHGIQGQRWGIRRYQNPDGTLTEEGKRRYLNPDGTLNRRGERKLGNPGLSRDAKARYRKEIASALEKSESGSKAIMKSAEKIAGFNKNNKRDKTPAETTLRAMSDAAKATSKFIENNKTSKIEQQSKIVRNGKVDISKLSDKELQDLVNRMRLEQNYGQLVESNKRSVDDGHEMAVFLLNAGAATMGVAAGVVGTVAAFNKIHQKRNGG